MVFFDNGEAGRPAQPHHEIVAPDFEAFQNPRKVFHHADRIHELQSAGDTRPVHMTIGLTNYCNHKCSWCYINWNQAGRAAGRSGAAVETMRKAINADDRLIEAIGEARALGLKAVTIVGDGEPTLHKHFVEYLGRLAAMGLQIGIFTNFSMTSEETLEALAEHCFFVRGSIDAANEEVHRKSHGSDDFDLVISNLKRLLMLRGNRPKPTVGVQFVTNQWNFWQLPDAARFYRDLGADYLTIKPAYKNDLNPAHPENEVNLNDAFHLMREAQSHATDRFKVFAKYPQFKEVVGQKTNDARYYKKCIATPLSPYLDEDGNVEMCGNLKGRGFTMGNIYESSFGEIWSSDSRKDCLSRIDLHKCPSGCKLDPLNKVLWDTFHPEEDAVHPNFV
jgi:GTP 3',8-cyclase